MYNEKWFQVVAHTQINGAQLVRIAKVEKDIMEDEFNVAIAKTELHAL